MYPQTSINSNHEKFVIGGLSFVSAKMRDAAILYLWRNDPESIRNSINANRINLEDHKNWFRQSLDSKKIKIFLAYFEKHPIGMFRFNSSPFGQPNSWEMSWTVSPKWRGMGMGKLIVSSGVELGKILFQGKKGEDDKNDGSVELWARILDHNIGSKRIAELAGLHFYHKENNLEFWKLNARP